MDVACGQGVLCRLLHGKGAEVTGVDAAAELIRAARQRGPEAIRYHVRDARELSRHTKPEVDEHDLAHLDVFTAVARVLVDNRELPAFTFVMVVPPRITLRAEADLRQPP